MQALLCLAGCIVAPVSVIFGLHEILAASLSCIANLTERRTLKSCVRLQVALIVFLAHIGSFVPAESAVIGLTDRCSCQKIRAHPVLLVNTL